MRHFNNPLFAIKNKVLFEDEHRRRSKEVHQPGIQHGTSTGIYLQHGTGHGTGQQHAHGAHASSLYRNTHPQLLVQGNLRNPC